MRYYIWDGLLHSKIMDSCGCCPKLFTTEEAAVNYRKLYFSGEYSIKAYETSQWAVRERHRLDDGTYLKPVWFEEPWYLDRAEDILSFDHVYSKDPTMIGYTPNPAKGIKDIQSTTKPGRFLTKFFSDVLTADEIKSWANKHTETYVEPPDGLLRWASTPEEIERVYSMPASFFSCMQAQRDKWASGVGHPTRAYGAGDLKVAYIPQGERLLARALVWREKGLVGRVYGDDVLLRTALKKEGITTQSNSNTYDSMIGARLLYIPLDREDSDDEPPFEDEGISGEFRDIVIPYIDGRSSGLNLYPDGFLRLEQPSLTDRYWAQYHGSSESGYAKSRDKCVCCGKWTVYTAEIELANEPLIMSQEPRYFTMCYDCQNKITFRCGVSGLYYDRATTETLTVHTRNLATTVTAAKAHCLGGNSVFKSELSGRYFTSKSICTIQFGRIISEHEFYSDAEKLLYIDYIHDYVMLEDAETFSNGKINMAGTLRKIDKYMNEGTLKWAA